MFTSYQLSLNVPRRLYKKPGAQGISHKMSGTGSQKIAVLDPRQEYSQRDMMDVRN